MILKVCGSMTSTVLLPLFGTYTRSGKPFTAGLMLPGRPAAYTSCGSSGGGIPGRRSADCAAASARSSVRNTFIITKLLYDERLCGSVQAPLLEFQQSQCSIVDNLRGDS